METIKDEFGVVRVINSKGFIDGDGLNPSIIIEGLFTATMLNNKLHNTNKPAIMFSSEILSDKGLYYLDGENLDKKEFKNRTFVTKVKKWL